MEMLPASIEFLNRLRYELGKDPKTTRVMLQCLSQWPATVFLLLEIREFSTLSSELTTVQDLLMCNDRLVILPSTRQDVLKRLITGHQMIVHYPARAQKLSVLARNSQHIHDFVQQCPTCLQFNPPPKGRSPADTKV